MSLGVPCLRLASSDSRIFCCNAGRSAQPCFALCLSFDVMGVYSLDGAKAAVLASPIFILPQWPYSVVAVFCCCSLGALVVQSLVHHHVAHMWPWCGSWAPFALQLLLTFGLHYFFGVACSALAPCHCCFLQHNWLYCCWWACHSRGNLAVELFVKLCTLNLTCTLA